LREVPLNEWQRLVTNRLLEGFEGKLTTSKEAALTKRSNDMAVTISSNWSSVVFLVRNQAGGRSTSYALAIGPQGVWHPPRLLGHPRRPIPDSSHRSRRTMSCPLR
jgi:hypothetical protein